MSGKNVDVNDFEIVRTEFTTGQEKDLETALQTCSRKVCLNEKARERGRGFCCWWGRGCLRGCWTGAERGFGRDYWKSWVNGLAMGRRRDLGKGWGSGWVTGMGKNCQQAPVAFEFGPKRTLETKHKQSNKN